MMPQQRVCRLCLEICDNFKAIDGDMKRMLDTLLPIINLAVTEDPMICANCARMLIKYFHFKAACFCARDYAVAFVNTKTDPKPDLIGVYQNRNEIGTGVAEDQNFICGFCMNPVKKCLALSIDFETGNMLKNMIERCLPELDLGVVKNPVICPLCHESLETCFRFLTNCLIIEEKIKQYCESLDVNIRDKIELSRLLQFTMRDVTTSEVEGNYVDFIKTGPQLCGERESADNSEIDKGNSVLELEQMVCDDSEKVKKEIEDESEDYMVNVEDLKFINEEAFTPKEVLACNEESNNFDVVNMEEIFCGEKESKEENIVKMEDQKYVLNEETEIKKAEEPDLVRFVADGIILPQSEVSTMLHRRQECLMSEFEENSLKPYRSTEKHVVTKTRMYRCNLCSFQTKSSSYLKIHMLTHKDPSEVTTYKCDSCSFQTVQKRVFKMHSLVHKDLSEVTVYKCDSCSFQTKHKKGLKAHMLKHKDSTEVTMYKCDSCSYQTKYKTHLKGHSLVHKDPSEIQMLKCDFCSYQAKTKTSLTNHLLTHKSPSEVTMHKCDSCSFQTRQKGNLKLHMLVHKNPSEITMYKCDSCSYLTKYKTYLKTHSLVHKDLSEEVMYKCDSCSFQTRRKKGLKEHLLVHLDPSEVTMYKCDSCSYQTKYRSGLKTHLLRHKDPSEVTMYKCDSCQYQTKQKGSLTSHSLIHKSSSEVPMYKCHSCSFQTIHESSIKSHLLVHKSPAEVTMYKCDSCSFQTKYRQNLRQHVLKHKNP